MSNCISAAMCCAPGNVRTNNEDAYYFNGTYTSKETMDLFAENHNDFDIDHCLFAVCDGIGGQKDGEEASYTAVSQLRTCHDLLTTSSFNEAVGHWIQETNTNIVNTTHGGCTLAMVYIDNKGINIAHVGDSRVYCLHENNLIRLTKDHSKMQLLIDAGLLTAEEAQTHPQRHMITRYLGMKKENGPCIPTISRSLPLADGERYLICTDGLTDMLSDTTIQSIMKYSKSTKDCVKQIYTAAMDAGGRDNITIIVFDISLDPNQSNEITRETRSKDNQHNEDSLDDTISFDTTLSKQDRRYIKVVQTLIMPSTTSSNRIDIVSEVRFV